MNRLTDAFVARTALVAFEARTAFAWDAFFDACGDDPGPWVVLQSQPAEIARG